jgi:hypothetical protein
VVRKHTPGPWRMGVDGIGIGRSSVSIVAPIGRGNERHIAKVELWGDDASLNDARLIADCPNLLDALTRLVGAIIRRSDELRNGSQTAAVSIISTANQLRHRFLLDDTALESDASSPTDEAASC